MRGRPLLDDPASLSPESVLITHKAYLIALQRGEMLGVLTAPVMTALVRIVLADGRIRGATFGGLFRPLPILLVGTLGVHASIAGAGVVGRKNASGLFLAATGSRLEIYYFQGVTPTMSLRTPRV